MIWKYRLACLCCGLLAGCEVETQPAVQQYKPASQQAAAETTPAQVARGRLRFVEGYERGYSEARRQNKPLLLFFTAEWCHYCHQMADEALTNDQVVSLSDRFVCVLVDADAAPDICRQFRVARFPTIQFVSPQGVVLNRLEGKRPGHQVTIAMQAALQTVARRTEPGASSR
jgi:thioredoxin-like negative regulator of GroEL